MSIDKELLWKAWPLGYVPMRGVQTISGWTCYRVGEDGTAFWAHPRLPEERITHGEKRYDLLPDVDPKDPAAWACLLADFARIAGLEEASTWHWGYEEWVDIHTKEIDEKGWHLHSMPWASSSSGARFDLDTQDPAEALVQALIMLQEK